MIAVIFYMILKPEWFVKLRSGQSVSSLQMGRYQSISDVQAWLVVVKRVLTISMSEYMGQYVNSSRCPGTSMNLKA